jgi:hypothetical protein
VREGDVRGTRASAGVRCTYCGGTGASGQLVEADVRGVRYDYCDAACATAHRQAVDLTEVVCADCDEPAVGDSGCCDEHLLGVAETGMPSSWRMAG